METRLKMSKGRVLVACEESGKLTFALRSLGVEAFSCDILPTRGGLPQFHLQQDVLPLLQEDWLAVFAFPPCDHLAVSGARWFSEKQKDGRQQKGIDFFLRFTDLPHVPYTLIENPIGIMSTVYRKPDQIIQPWQYGEDAKKSTCLWLKGLPLLQPTTPFNGDKKTKRANQRPDGQDRLGESSFRKLLRSETYTGIAKAIASQYKPFLV